jgi:hypothetical protein
MSPLPRVSSDARLAALPRIGTSPIVSRAVFIARLDELASSLESLGEASLTEHPERLLAALPGLGTFPFNPAEGPARHLEELAFLLADLREARFEQKHKYWWRLADALDDVMDLHDALSRPLR